jgi:hypothetical protein
MKTRIIFPYVDLAAGSTAGSSVTTYRDLLIYDTKVSIDAQKKTIGGFGFPSLNTQASQPVKLGLDLKDIDYAYTVTGYLLASSRQDGTDTYAYNAVDALLKLQESGLPCAVLPMFSTSTVMDTRFAYLATGASGATSSGTTITISSGLLSNAGVRKGHYARFGTSNTYYRISALTSNTQFTIETASSTSISNAAYYISPCSILQKAAFNIIPEDTDAPENIECTLQFLRQVSY